MFQSITFYIGGKTLGIYEEEFPLGALTTEILNITPAEYQVLNDSLKSAIEGMALYEKTHKLPDWHRANAQMLRLNEALCRHRIFLGFPSSLHMHRSDVKSRGRAHPFQVDRPLQSAFL